MLKHNRRWVFVITLMLFFLFSLTGCGYNRYTAFVVAGSTSVQPYVEMLAEEYAYIFPDMEIDVQGGGSSAGIQAVESGVADIGMSSRNLKESELHLWSTEIAKDGLAIIVHPDNPIKNLTLEQLCEIYSSDNISWSRFGGEDKKIHIITREEGSGTRSAFEELVMIGKRITPRAIVQDSNGSVRQLVSDDPYSIGFISLGLVEVGERPVKALSINGVEPVRENVINSTYTLYRSFWFVALEELVGDTMLFLNYINSPEGQKLLTDEGLIPDTAAVNGEGGGAVNGVVK